MVRPLSVTKDQRATPPASHSLDKTLPGGYTVARVAAVGSAAVMQRMALGDSRHRYDRKRCDFLAISLALLETRTTKRNLAARPDPVEDERPMRTPHAGGLLHQLEPRRTACTHDSSRKADAVFPFLQTESKTHRVSERQMLGGGPRSWVSDAGGRTHGEGV